MQKLMSQMRSAMEKYNMISDGDKIAVGVSGGKDSLALIIALNEMRRFFPKKYEVVGLTIDPCFNNEQGDYSKIEELLNSQGIEYHIKRTELYKIIFQDRMESNPCSLCARMRRGLLHDFAKEYGCNKIALGHHLDDAAQTLLMNLFNGARISCFSPISYLSRKDLYMIRPMIFAYEKDVERAARNFDLPVVKSKCPADGVTERENMKNLLRELEHTYPKLREKIIKALQTGDIDGWGV
ncbi:MAG: tRNA 2-thiocytidine(32) synthetase TtcA [Clostridiales bacterium]|nr:tRNA 2-thiocytidine(32) synthetase TtcA [Clostridiales bacterium]